jgi:PKD repeat protein
VVVVVDNDTPPAGQFTASPTTARVGQVVTFTDAHPGNHRRQVTFGDGTMASVRSPTFTKTYGATGSYLVTLQTIDVVTGQRVTLSLTITVIPGTTVFVSTLTAPQSSPTAFCPI